MLDKWRVLTWLTTTAIAVGCDAGAGRNTELSQRSLLSTGVDYTWDCSADASVFGGEVKVYLSDSSAAGCLGFGAGTNSVMQVSLPEWNWPGTSNAIVDIWNAHGKGHDFFGVHHNDTCFYQNASGGNPSRTRPTTLNQFACWDPYPSGGTFFVGLGTVTQSFEHIGRCGPGATPC